MQARNGGADALNGLLRDWRLEQRDVLSWGGDVERLIVLVRDGGIEGLNIAVSD